MCMARTRSFGQFILNHMLCNSRITHIKIVKTFDYFPSTYCCTSNFLVPKSLPQNVRYLNLDDETDELLPDFLSYFEATWIGVVQRGRRRRPLFSVSLWNVHGRVEQDLPRTNNSIEGWHHSFDLRVAITHPTIRDWPPRSLERTSQQRTSPRASAGPNSSAATKEEIPGD